MAGPATDGGLGIGVIDYCAAHHLSSSYSVSDSIVDTIVYALQNTNM